MLSVISGAYSVNKCLGTYYGVLVVEYLLSRAHCKEMFRYILYIVYYEKHRITSLKFLEIPGPDGSVRGDGKSVSFVFVSPDRYLALHDSWMRFFVTWMSHDYSVYL